MHNDIRMNGSEVLSTSHAVEVILMLGESDRMVSDFLTVTSNFYTVEKILSKLEDSGIITEKHVERSKGTWYTLTPSGMIVADCLKTACKVIDGQ